MITKDDIIINEQNSCIRVFIPKGVCTVYLMGADDRNIEVSKVGNDVCIENLDMSLPCFAEEGHDLEK